MSPFKSKMFWDLQARNLKNNTRATTKTTPGRIVVIGEGSTLYDAYWDAIGQLEEDHGIDTLSLHDKGPTAPKGLIEDNLPPEPTGKTYRYQIALRPIAHRMIKILLDKRAFCIKIASEPAITRYTLLCSAGYALCGGQVKSSQGGDEALVARILNSVPEAFKPNFQTLEIETMHTTNNALLISPFNHDRVMWEIHRDLFQRSSIGDWEEYLASAIENGRLQPKALEWTFDGGPLKANYRKNGTGNHQSMVGVARECDLTPEMKKEKDAQRKANLAQMGQFPIPSASYAL